MMTKMAECSYLLIQEPTFETKLSLDYKILKKFSKLINNINNTHISLITLTFFIISCLTWLVLRNLKEGRKALTEVNKNR